MNNLIFSTTLRPILFRGFSNDVGQMNTASLLRGLDMAGPTIFFVNLKMM